VDIVYLEASSMGSCGFPQNVLEVIGIADSFGSAGEAVLKLLGAMLLVWGSSWLAQSCLQSKKLCRSQQLLFVCFR
jgi:hypothetical protein